MYSIYKKRGYDVRFNTKKTQGKKVYYYYHESYRQKISPEARGKAKGSGQSRVINISHYLGTAKDIYKKYKNFDEPVSVAHRNFGVIAAAYQTAREIGLIDILKKHIPGNRFGDDNWLYFLFPILNRLDHATSKNQMSIWLSKTILPALLNFDIKNFNSKKFWYVTDDVISEKEVKQADDDLFKGVDVEVFNKIEEELFQNIAKQFKLSDNVFFYDTTNFYTYIEEPARSRLAKTGHNKDSKHHLKQVGLLMAVESNFGIPFLHKIYRGNSHDTKTFYEVVAELILRLKQICKTDSDIILVLDKGNNSKDNFAQLAGNVSWIGSLTPSHHEELIDIELTDYTKKLGDTKYFRTSKKVMGHECVIIVTFNEKLKRKQEYTFQRNTKKVKEKVIEKWNRYKRKPKKVVPKGILSILKDCTYGKYITPQINDGEIKFNYKDNETTKRKKYFGKNIIFSNLSNAKSENIITTYRDKNKIEDDNKLLKDKDIICFNPIRHWTDSKIRAYAFCCVMSMTLLKIMQLKADLNGYKMSARVLMEELRDLKEIIMIYSHKRAKRLISHQSTVQSALWDIFKMEEVKKITTIHN